jgi:hypothetical protein
VELFCLALDQEEENLKSYLAKLMDFQDKSVILLQ